MKVTIKIELNKDQYEVKNEDEAVAVVEQLIKDKKYQIIITDEANNSYTFV